MLPFNFCNYPNDCDKRSNYFPGADIREVPLLSHSEYLFRNVANYSEKGVFLQVYFLKAAMRRAGHNPTDVEVAFHSISKYLLQANKAMHVAK